jgi:zinc transport system permease protein
MADKLLLFFQSWDLVGGAVLAGVITGAVCGFIGIYVVLHRIVFVSAAMSQVSSLGVMIAFALAQSHAVESSHHTEDILPLVLASIFTGVFSAFLAGSSQRAMLDRSRSSEGFIGAVYLLATAGLLMVGDRITQGAHDVSNVLFGNAVMVDTPHLVLLASVCVPVLVVHLWLKKDFLLVSFDPVMASTLGYPVTRLRVLLLILLGVVISISTRVIGALPVFSLGVMPPMAALMLSPDLKRSFWLALVIGAASAFLGYLGSFLYSFPTGACIAAASGGFLLLARLSRR